jgi:hypothetical protein
MRVYAVVGTIILHATIVASWAIGQDSKPGPFHQMIGGVSLTASSMQRDISRASYTPVIQLKGSVEIIKPLCVPAGRNGALVCEEEMVLRADEAEYHEDSGEIIPAGHVRVSFETRARHTI